MRIATVFMIILSIAGTVLADSCPYCGKEYGDAMPGDEARVAELRRQHEATCPMRPTAATSGSQPQPGTNRGQIQSSQRMDQRRLELKQQLKEAEEMAKARIEKFRQQFELDKQEVLNMLKSGTSITPKHDQPTVPTLKEPQFSKGYKGSAPPYLADLDSKWPLVVDPAKVQGNTTQALRLANLKTHALLDALEFGSGDWEVSIQYLKNRLANKPEDLAVRDALDFLCGLHRGYLGCKNVADNHYKYGIRKWLEEDYDTAARAFARSVRENPDDIAAFRTFAYTLGLRAGSGKYKAAGGTYPHIEIPEKKTIDAAEATKLKELRQAAAANPQNLKLRSTLNFVEGLAAYDDYLDPAVEKKPKPLDDRSLKLSGEGLTMMGQEDYDGAFRAFAEAYKNNLDDRGLLFVQFYAGGLAAARRDDSSYEPWDPRMNEVFKQLTLANIEKDLDLFFQEEPIVITPDELNEQLMDTDKRNPFFGLLSDEQVQRLKERTIFK